MADAQDLKMKKWLFFLISSACLTSGDSLVFTGEKSHFACLPDAPLSRPKVAQKVAHAHGTFRRI
jgi:hypothetical protein